MIDINLFKAILERDDCGYIESGDRIPLELMELFSHYSYEKVKSLFKKKGEDVDRCLFLCEVKCSKCGKVFEEEMSKTGVLNYIRMFKKKNYELCQSCREERKREEAEYIKEAKERNEVIRKENTDAYIDTFLNPSHAWKEGTKTYKKLHDLKMLDVDWGGIKDYIVNMEYKDFLMTPYWKAVAEKVRQRAGFRCQLCNSNANLNVHHRTYSHHGDEIHHMDDLICICGECHEKYHF